MYCKYCGTKNEPGAAFCKNCGQPIGRVNDSGNRPESKAPQQQPQATTTEANSAAPRASVGQRTQPLAPKGPKRSNWLWIVIIAVVVVGVIGFAYFQLGQDDKVTGTPSASSKQDTQSKLTTKTSASSAASASSHTSTVTFPKNAVQRDIDQNLSNLDGTTSVAVLPVTGNGRVVNNNQSQRAASLIKLFVLVTAYQQSAQHQLNLKDTYTLQSSDKVGGTGTLQNLPNGSKLTYQEIAKRMMDESDNTAANIMIDAVGGMRTVNHEIDKLGLTDTKLERHLMDTDALESGKDNYTSVTDVATVLKKIYNHQLVSTSADDAMLAVLQGNENHTKLPHDLPSSATVYNKTGEYSDYGVQNDAAIIKNSTGAFIVVVLSQDGKEQQQVTAMNELGLALYHTILQKD